MEIRTCTNTACNVIIGMMIATNSAIAQPIPAYTPIIPQMTSYSANNGSNTNNVFYDYAKALTSIHVQQNIIPSNKFTVIDKPEVETFLNSNPELYSRLDDTYINIKKYFPEANINLSVSVDPDIKNYEHLMVGIQVDMLPDVAIPRLYELWEEWFFTEMADVKDKMIVDVEFA